MLSQRELFLRHLAQTTDNPLLIEIEKAEGCYLYGPQGQRYLDLISGISVSNVGHRHPKVLQAIHEQLDKYMHLMVYGEYVQSPQVRLAKALADTLPAPLESVYLVNSGSEAVEGALKLAKRYTGRPNLVSCFHAYHGSSQGALSVGGSEEFKRAYRPLLPGVQHMYFGVEAELEKISTDTAAVIIETVQGEAGVRSACTRYWQALSKRCKETGTLLILDEIQTGFGRTGTFWGFEHYGIQPDILVTAKGMGGGMPIGAFISSRHIMQSLSENPILGHITTFGGHPVSAAASLATLQLIVEEELHTLVASKAALFKALLVHPKIKMLRQMGFLMALEFEDFTQNKRIIDRAIAKGLITDWFLFCDNSLRIAPPLVINESQIREACAVILECVDEVG